MTPTQPKFPLASAARGMLVAIAVTASALACGGPQDSGASQRSGQRSSQIAGQRSGPDFSLKDLDGRTVRLSDYRGKIVLVNFWATWCVPCAAELPHLQRLYETYRDRGLMVLAISMDGPESIAAVGPKVRQYGLRFPVLLDEETRVVGVFNPKRAAPFTVLIGRDGAVEKTREGYSAGDEVALEADLKALLDGQ